MTTSKGYIHIESYDDDWNGKFVIATFRPDEIWMPEKTFVDWEMPHPEFFGFPFAIKCPDYNWHLLCNEFPQAQLVLDYLNQTYPDDAEVLVERFRWEPSS